MAEDEYLLRLREGAAAGRSVFAMPRLNLLQIHGLLDRTDRARGS